MSPDALFVLQLLVIATGPMVAVGLMVVVLAWVARDRRRRGAEYRSQAERLGLQVEGRLPDHAVVRGRVDGIDVTMATTEMTRQTSRGAKRATRGVITSVAPSRWADAAVLRRAPDHFGLGQLTELHFEPWFRFRVFASVPPEVASWLSPRTREAISAAGEVESVSIRSGAVSLVLSAPPDNAQDLRTAMQLVANIQRGVEPTLATAPMHHRKGGAHRGVVAFLGALLVAFLGWGLVPLFEPVASALSLLVCEDDGVAFTTTSSHRGGGSLTYGCDFGTHTTRAGVLGYPALASVTGTTTLVMTYASILGLIRALTRRRTDQGTT